MIDEMGNQRPLYIERICHSPNIFARRGMRMGASCCIFRISCSPSKIPRAHNHYPLCIYHICHLLCHHLIWTPNRPDFLGNPLLSGIVHRCDHANKFCPLRIHHFSNQNYWCIYRISYSPSKIPQDHNHYPQRILLQQEDLLGLGLGQEDLKRHLPTV